MDELDQSARTLIRLARAEERAPSRAIRWRVQRGVAMAAPAAALLSGSVSTAAAKGVAASIGALGLKASFIFGIACGVGVTSVGYGVASYRNLTSVRHEPAKVATATGSMRRLDTRPQQAAAATPDEVLPGVQDPPATMDPPPDHVQSLARMTTQSPLKSRSLAVPKPASEPTEAPVAPSNPTLAAEVDLLTEVQSQLRNGRPSAALESLYRDDGRFVQSPLRPDLDAVRIFTLCELGRVEEALRATDVFLQRYPGSPLVQRVRSACTARGPSAQRASEPPLIPPSHNEP